MKTQDLLARVQTLDAMRQTVDKISALVPAALMDGEDFTNWDVHQIAGCVLFAERIEVDGKQRAGDLVVCVNAPEARRNEFTFEPDEHGQVYTVMLG